MSISLELSFKCWLQQIIDSRISSNWDLDSPPQNPKECEKLLRALQLNTTENEFQTIILLSDNCCICKDNICLFCYIYEVTEKITPSVYMDLVLLDFDEIKNYC